ncbi:LHFPL tetraspan subfamily member 4 protein [Oxyura jamaicensis]|uniref:LHFPL tetraspan subfamily member 4 protein n=1 Tax=Oxyura jamaicensis TaxID=8884 RepID=UPI0015A593D0|nr:LHFPL tetraspan subfamily member 4 protein [Oxyura jamaicensis]
MVGAPCGHGHAGQGITEPSPAVSLHAALCPAALCLVLGCMIFPDGWDAETIRDMCGEKTGKYSLGDCSVRWAYILAIIGILNALILSFLAFVLGNRQNDLLHEELKTESKDFVGTARI